MQVLTVMVEGTHKVTHARTHGCLHLIDLAGSESAKVGRRRGLAVVIAVVWRARLGLNAGWPSLFTAVNRPFAAAAAARFLLLAAARPSTAGHRRLR